MLLTGCAHTPTLGAAKPPAPWAAASNSCADLAGTYSEVGSPAAENSRAWLYTLVWPNAGSLASFAESGTNGLRYFPPLARVRVEVDANGNATFGAVDVAGGQAPLKPREWRCEDGMLVTRGPVNPLPYALDRRQESLVRVWKARDGALIVEDTFREGRHDSDENPTPLARFYFRFAGT
jgi:hypothetical protein